MNFLQKILLRVCVASFSLFFFSLNYSTIDCSTVPVPQEWQQAERLHNQLIEKCGDEQLVRQYLPILCSLHTLRNVLFTTYVSHPHTELTSQYIAENEHLLTKLESVAASLLADLEKDNSEHNGNNQRDNEDEDHLIAFLSTLHEAEAYIKRVGADEQVRQNMPPPYPQPEGQTWAQQTQWQQDQQPPNWLIFAKAGGIIAAATAIGLLARWLYQSDLDKRIVFMEGKVPELGEELESVRELASAALETKNDKDALLKEHGRTIRLELLENCGDLKQRNQNTLKKIADIEDKQEQLGIMIQKLTKSTSPTSNKRASKKNSRRKLTGVK